MILVQKFRRGTSSGGDLARALDIPIYTPSRIPRPIVLVGGLINWGLTNIPWLIGSEGVGVILNHPSKVKISSNKLKAFGKLEGITAIPEYTTNKEVAESYIHDGDKVVCRQLLSASGGRGIVIASSIDELVDAPLYTKYIKKKWEYRVHVAFGEIIYIQQKRRLSSEQLEERGITSRSKYIRNLENGYIYSNNLSHSTDEGVYDDLLTNSITAISSLGLDFGAVDLVVTKDGEVFVLEVNTAPGLEGNTFNAYLRAFKRKFQIE